MQNDVCTLSGNTVNVTAGDAVDHAAPPMPLEAVPPVVGVPSGGGVQATDPGVYMLG